MSSLRTSLIIAVLAAAAITPATIRAATPATATGGWKHGCRTWNPRFRPVLATLGAGQILVALPSYLPAIGERTFVHADIYQPPLTYHVWLTTSRSAHIRKQDVILEMVGDARPSASFAGSHTVTLKGKTLHVFPFSGGVRQVGWEYGGIDYLVNAVSRLPLSEVERIAASLTPGALRKTPITASSSGKNSPSPCA